MNGVVCVYPMSVGSGLLCVSVRREYIVERECFCFLVRRRDVRIGESFLKSGKSFNFLFCFFMSEGNVRERE